MNIDIDRSRSKRIIFEQRRARKKDLLHFPHYDGSLNKLSNIYRVSFSISSNSDMNEIQEEFHFVKMLVSCSKYSLTREKLSNFSYCKLVRTQQKYLIKILLKPLPHSYTLAKFNRHERQSMAFH